MHDLETEIYCGIVDFEAEVEEEFEYLDFNICLDPWEAFERYEGSE